MINPILVNSVVCFFNCYWGCRIFAVLDVRLAWVQIIGILLILAGAAGNNLFKKA